MSFEKNFDSIDLWLPYLWRDEVTEFAVTLLTFYDVKIIIEKKTQHPTSL